jgi:hypothetical protein
MPLVLSAPDLRVNEGAAWTLLLHPDWPFREYDVSRLRRLLGAGAHFDLLVESFTSPLRSDRLVVAIVPGASSNAIDAIRSLITPSERQGPVYGGVAVSHHGRFESFLVGTRAYRAGELDRHQYITLLLIENYGLIPPLVVLLAAVIVVWVRRSAERVAERRLAPGEPNRGVSP